MKLPLYLHHDHYGVTLVVDAEHKIVCRLSAGNIKFGRAVVRKLNRNWRWRLFGAQPYVYTREDWLFERNRRPRDVAA